MTETDPHKRAAMVNRMGRLRFQLRAREISKRKFKEEHGALASALWGPDFSRNVRILARQGNQVSEGSSNDRA